MKRPSPSTLAIAALAIAAVALMLIVVPGSRRSEPSAAPADPPAPAAAERKITATLYYIAEDGMSLVGTQREVPFGEGVLEQARHILAAQLGDAPAPLASAVPEGTALRALYVTERGDAFVDLSSEARTNHTGGALDELFTVYAIVDALTVNLPAITRVQILVDGKEVDTLAGHVDLRHPLEKSLQWVSGTKDES
jgi:spore germination protein GerM